MWETSARLLKLLSLLQARREWNGPELAERLGISERTVRRDVERLRALGYPVDATRGTDGGYRLGRSAVMPPLLLDDDEAVAIAVGLRGAARSPVADIEESSARALAKLEQVLPPRLRGRVTALTESVVDIPPDTPPPPVDAGALAAFAAAVRDRETVRFDYEVHGGEVARRRVEPHRLVVWGHRWYLLAWDLDRADWRTYRLDRAGAPVPPHGPRFAARVPPEDAATYVQRGVSTAGMRVRARVLVRAPAHVVVQRINPAVGVVEALDEESSVLHTGADTLETVALHLGMLGTGFEVTEPPELVEHVRRLGELYRAATPPGGSPPS